MLGSFTRQGFPPLSYKHEAENISGGHFTKYRMAFSYIEKVESLRGNDVGTWGWVLCSIV
jgi:hypothetical protein